MDEFKKEKWDGTFKLTAERARLTWIIWGMMLASLFVYVVIGFLMRQGQGMKPAQSADQLQLFLMIFGGLALIETMILFVVLPKILIHPLKDFEQAASAYFTYSVVRYALAESIAIFGLIYFFVGGEALYFLIFVGWSVLLNLMFAPTVRDQELFARVAKQRQ